MVYTHYAPAPNEVDLVNDGFDLEGANLAPHEGLHCQPDMDRLLTAEESPSASA